MPDKIRKLAALRAADAAAGIVEVRRQETLLKTGALQNAILNSANFSSIATDEKGVIQIFNVGAEHMLGYIAADVLNKITPADISDPEEMVARAKALSLELATTIKPGFEALVFKASRGIKEGTGIGQVVTKRLVELMGGAIGVESTAGVGSEFWIELVRDVTPQLAVGHPLPKELTAIAEKNAAWRTLLYVEDNPANLMLVEQIIEGHAHVRMLSAHDGNLGITPARSHLPDVILMDINLPGISDFDALKILREDPATKHIPVIALGANAMLRDIDEGLDAGFFRYLTKPIRVGEFMDALDGALEFSKTGIDNAMTQESS